MKGVEKVDIKAILKDLCVCMFWCFIRNGKCHLFVHLHLKLDDIVTFHGIENDTNKHDDHS